MTEAIRQLRSVEQEEDRSLRDDHPMNKEVLLRQEKMELGIIKPLDISTEQLIDLVRSM